MATKQKQRFLTKLHLLIVWVKVQCWKSLVMKWHISDTSHIHIRTFRITQVCLNWSVDHCTRLERKVVHSNSVSCRLAGNKMSVLRVRGRQRHIVIDVSSVMRSELWPWLNSVTHISWQEMGRCQHVLTSTSMIALKLMLSSFIMLISVATRRPTQPTSCHSNAWRYLAVTSRCGWLIPNVIIHRHPVIGTLQKKMNLFRPCFHKNHQSHRSQKASLCRCLVFFSIELSTFIWRFCFHVWTCLRSKRRQSCQSASWTLLSGALSGFGEFPSRQNVGYA